MSQIASQLVSKILRNIQVDEDGSAPAVQAQTDALSYLNERALDVWKRRLWREYIITGYYSVPANTRKIDLSSITVDSIFSSGSGRAGSFHEVFAIRNGNSPLTPVDPGSINSLDPSLWASTSNPSQFVNLGQDGILLLGTFSEATTLYFAGKAAYLDLVAASTWILDSEGTALVEGVTGDMIRDHDRDDNRATIRYKKYEEEIAKLIDAQEVQGSNIKQIIPANPWTGYDGDFQGSNYTSRTGGSFFI